MENISENQLLNTIAIETLLGIRSADPFRIRTEKIGWGKLRDGVSMSGESLRLNGLDYHCGWGDHSQSRHVVEQLPGPGKRFEVLVGFHDGGIVRENAKGKLIFKVEANGQVLAESNPLAVGDAPEKLTADLNGAQSFVLKAINTEFPEDYAGCPSGSHADWVNPTISMADGRVFHLSNGAAFRSMLPAFLYDGVAVDLKEWDKHIARLESTPDFDAYKVQYDAPDGLLRLLITSKIYKDFPAVEWLPELVAIGNEPSGIVEDFMSLHLEALTPSEEIVIRRTTGTKTSRSDFVKYPVILQRRHGFNKLTLDTDEGASSAAWMPFFGLDLSEQRGIEVGIGWTGSWKADIINSESVSISAGMLKTHFHVLPAETIRQPSILLFIREDVSVREAGKQFRRFMIKHKSPRNSRGKLFDASLSLMTGGGNVSDETMLRMVDFVKKNQLPVDTLWIDAGWYGAPREVDMKSLCGGWSTWYDHVGDWRVNTVIHPDGSFKEVSRAANGAGMKFLLWLEIERAMQGSPVTEEHPEYFFIPQDANSGGNNGYLLNLGQKEARDWAIETVSALIRKNNIGCYRQDFNITALAGSLWRASDAKNRQGISEAKHIAGLYEFWDTLKKRFPDLLIDNCASGGRRLDFEMISRSHCYANDDITASKTYPEVSQNITINTINYVPFQCGLTSDGTFMDDYNFMSYVSSATALSPASWGFLERDFNDVEIGWLHKMMGHAVRFREYFKGDFYPLTDNPGDNSTWCAYQCDREELNEGFIIAFRREECRESELNVQPGSIDSAAEYQLEFFDGTKKCSISGAELAFFKIALDTPRTFCLCYYKKIKGDKK